MRVPHLIAMSSIISAVVSLNQTIKNEMEKTRLAGARLKRMPGHRKSIALFIAIALMWLLTLVAGALAQSTDNPLEQGFKQPPDSAKPRTWWHWTSSNVTEEGITKDLEWMKRAGIAVFQLADVNAGGGQTLEKKIV